MSAGVPHTRTSDGETEAEDPRLAAIPDSHGHAKGEHKPFAEERPIPYTARMLFLWFYHACRRGSPRFMMVADHMNYLTFEDPAAVNLVRRALKLAAAGDLYGAAETAGVELNHAAVVSEGLRKGMRYSIGAEVDNDPRSRPDAQNIVDAMRPDGMVRSVHFLAITHPQHGENWMWAFDNAEFKDLYDTIGTQTVWEIYMKTLLEAIEKLPGHIIGHFYVPAVFGHWPEDAVLQKYEDQLIAACAERGMAIEINSRYLYKHYLGDDAQLKKFRTVHLRLMRKAKAKNVAIAVGSDAHSPKDQGAAFERILALLDEADVNEIAFPINGRLARVALRATEELMRQQAPPPPAPFPVRAEAPVADGKIGTQVKAAAKTVAKAVAGAVAKATGKPPPKSAAKAEAPKAAAKADAKPVKAAKIEKPAPKASVKAAARPSATSSKKPAPRPAAAKSGAKRTETKRAGAKKTVKPTARKAATRPKPAAKKAPKRAAAARKTAKRPVPKRAAAKRPAAKRPAAKRAGTKRPAPKRAAPKRSAAKKSAPKKTAHKKSRGGARR